MKLYVGHEDVTPSITKMLVEVTAVEQHNDLVVLIGEPKIG